MLWESLESRAEITSVNLGFWARLAGYKGKRVVFKGEAPILIFQQESNEFLVTYEGNRYRIPSKIGNQLLKRLEKKE